MQTSTSLGMQTMEQSLADLVLRHVITTDVAYARSSRPDQLRGLLERAVMTSPVAPAPTDSHKTPTPTETGLRLASEV
jgi:hypothetical protein